MCLSRGGGVKGSVTSEKGPKHRPDTAMPGGRRTPVRTARRAWSTGFSTPDYLSQASTLSLLASTHFFAAASGVILSTAMYLATVFWSSLVQLNFFTRS
jgi:hypothetical protein